MLNSIQEFISATERPSDYLALALAVAITLTLLHGILNAGAFIVIEGPHMPVHSNDISLWSDILFRTGFYPYDVLQYALAKILACLFAVAVMVGSPVLFYWVVDRTVTVTQNFRKSR